MSHKPSAFSLPQSICTPSSDFERQSKIHAALLSAFLRRGERDINRSRMLFGSQREK